MSGKKVLTFAELLRQAKSFEEWSEERRKIYMTNDPYEEPLRRFEKQLLVSVDVLRQWQQEAFGQIREVIDRNWDDQSQFIPCKAPCARHIELAFKEILRVLGLEDKP